MKIIFEIIILLLFISKLRDLVVIFFLRAGKELENRKFSSNLQGAIAEAKTEANKSRKKGYLPMVLAITEIIIIVIGLFTKEYVLFIALLLTWPLIGVFIHTNPNKKITEKQITFQYIMMALLYAALLYKYFLQQ